MLGQGASAYQALIDQKLWGPNVGIKDRSGAPESMTAEVNALVQKQLARFKKFENKGNNKNSGNIGNSGKGGQVKSKVKCYYYSNEMGHYKNECPKLNGKTSNFIKKTTWKFKGPNSGDPQTKMVGGIEYQWCGKCGIGRWTTSHGTKDHKDSFNPSG